MGKDACFLLPRSNPIRENITERVFLDTVLESYICVVGTGLGSRCGAISKPPEGEERCTSPSVVLGLS